MPTLAMTNLDRPALATAAAPSSIMGRAPTGQAGSGVDFSQYLAPRDGATGRLYPTREQKARTAAQQLVATTLVKPILSQMRRDPFRVAMFHGGQAEDAFGGQMDTVLADRITSASNFSIVGAVEREITRKGGRAAAQTQTQAAAAQFMPTTTGVHLDAHG